MTAQCNLFWSRGRFACPLSDPSIQEAWSAWLRLSDSQDGLSMIMWACNEWKRDTADVSRNSHQPKCYTFTFFFLLSTNLQDQTSVSSVSGACLHTLPIILESSGCSIVR